MAISRIPGFSLLSDLDRQGVDLQFTTNSQTLAYLDFANYRLGINTTTPQEAIHIVGNALIDGHVLNSSNISFDIGSTTNWWRTVYASSISATSLSGTLTTSSQPNITSLGTLSTLNVTGTLTAGNINATISGNVSGTVLNNNQPYITSVGTLSNLTVAGNVVAPSFYGNLLGNVSGYILTAVQPNITELGILSNLNVAGNVLASNYIGTLTTSSQPNITSVGTLTGLTINGTIGTLSNIVGNIGSTTDWWNWVFTNTIHANEIYGAVLTENQPYISTLSNITVTNALINSNVSVYGYLTVNNAIHATTIAQNGNIVLDAATTFTVTGNVTGTGTYASLELLLTDTGVTPGVYGSTSAIPILDVDSKGRITSITVSNLNKIGNLIVTDTSIASNSSITLSTSNNGNITLDANGTGMVHIIGTDSVVIPSGNSAARPVTPPIGSVRFNTDINSIEYFDGFEWGSPTHQAVTSESISPNGIGNAFVLSEPSTSAGLFVSINGTVQQPDVAYHVVGNVITFTETPQVTDSIEIRSLISGSIASKTLQSGNTIIEVFEDSITAGVYGNPVFEINRGGAIVSKLVSTSVLATTTGIIDTYDKTLYRSAKYIVQSTSVTNSETSEVLVTHDGAGNAYSMTYGIINTGTSLGNVSSSISGNLVQLQYTAALNNVTIKISKNYITL